MKEKINIFWFRRDLRLHDNVAFYSALKSDIKLLPIFIYDKEILDDLVHDDARVTFIHELLSNINDELRKVKSSLATFYGTPSDVFHKLISENNVDTVFANHDYEPYAISRDAKIEAQLQHESIDFITFKDQVIFERNEIVKDDGKPYQVFTPFANKWKATLKPQQLELSDVNLQHNQFHNHNYSFLNLSEIGFMKSTIQVTPFDLTNDNLKNYSVARDFPIQDATTHLSPYLRFGAVSIRQIFNFAFKNKHTKLIDELIWREFFMQILWHFPHTVTKSFKPQYDQIKWRNNDREFEAWKHGKTGYPIVDAGMRELNATGIMHNRVRMIVAGFLCKHLLIDWRWGEAYFAEKLLDYEQSSNIGNWQWAAGSGVDAAPYFRIFNPTEQVKKFDKDLKYIKKWVPDLEDINYPQPIVDHKEARERCLITYKQALN